jgi:hypothetical protein
VVKRRQVLAACARLFLDSAGDQAPLTEALPTRRTARKVCF